MCRKFSCKFSCKFICKFTYCFCAHMHEIVKYFMLTDIYSEIDRRTLDPLKLIECRAGSVQLYSLASSTTVLYRTAVADYCTVL